MNYQNHYERLIEKAKNRSFSGYTERHHVIPKCMGGSNDIDNLVDLTPEEHYVAHQLLAKIYPSNRDLVFSMHMLTFDKHGNRLNNKMFGWVRRKMSKAISEMNKANAKDRTRKAGLTQRGKILSDDHKRKLAEAGHRRVQTQETRKKQSVAALNRSVEVVEKRLEMHNADWYREKLSKAAKNKKWMVNLETGKTSFVSSELFDEFLANGWDFGRARK